MIERKAAAAVSAGLARQAAVVLLGPRQVGKTTLARAVERERGGLYLDLQSVADRRRLDDPAAFFSRYADRLVVLDEIHRFPELFAELRGVIDRGREAGFRYGRFLMLGSASIDLLRQASETLAGRVAFVDLTPLLVSEVARDAPSTTNLWLRGGFPESFLAPDDAASFAVREDLVRTYLHRDVREFAPRIALDTLERLWLMLAHVHGGLHNASRLAASLGVDATTVGKYVDVLEHLFLVRRLRPFHANLKKRLVKAPKIYLRDSGVLHALLGIRDYYDIAGSPSRGASWEGFVIENVLAAVGPCPVGFYRTAAGAEMDLVLEPPRAGRIAIEIKSAVAFKLERGFHEARADLEPRRTYVVHGGADRYPLKDGVEAIGLPELCRELAMLREARDP